MAPAPAPQESTSLTGERFPVSTAPNSMPNGLALALALFTTQKRPSGLESLVSQPARAEFLYRVSGEWKIARFEDPQSDVFHKVMLYDPGDGPRLLTLGGNEAIVRTWQPGAERLESTDLWKENFSEDHSRMRDAEAADLFGDGRTALAVATHDQGVVGIVRPETDGYRVTRIHEKANTYVHEIETGDVDGDGVLEVYATPSDPNRIGGTPQRGMVIRFVPATGEGPVVVADLGRRHAKEILVDDIDGDGRDELYVAVEAVTTGDGLVQTVTIPVEIRRYEADSPASSKTIIGRINDAHCRVLTAGDLEGDGNRELIATAFTSGIWLFRPGTDPMEKWKVEQVDRDSAGFEHAAILTDLDEDGADELYVASDKHKEVRRYWWDGEKLAREVIYRRPDQELLTWNLMPVPLELIPGR